MVISHENLLYQSILLLMLFKQSMHLVIVFRLTKMTMILPSKTVQNLKLAKNELCEKIEASCTSLEHRMHHLLVLQAV